MSGPKEYSKFCFPETLNVPQGKAEGNIEVEGKQNSLFPMVRVIKCLVIPPNSKIEIKLQKNCLLDAGWDTNLLQFQEYNLITCELKAQVVVSLGSW